MSANNLQEERICTCTGSKMSANVRDPPPTHPRHSPTQVSSESMPRKAHRSAAPASRSRTRVQRARTLRPTARSMVSTATRTRPRPARAVWRASSRTWRVACAWGVIAVWRCVLCILQSWLNQLSPRTMPSPHSVSHTASHTASGTILRGVVVVCKSTSPRAGWALERRQRLQARPAPNMPPAQGSAHS